LCLYFLDFDLYFLLKIGDFERLRERPLALINLLPFQVLLPLLFQLLNLNFLALNLVFVPGETHLMLFVLFDQNLPQFGQLGFSDLDFVEHLLLKPGPLLLGIRNAAPQLVFLLLTGFPEHFLSLSEFFLKRFLDRLDLQFVLLLGFLHRLFVLLQWHGIVQLLL